MKTVYKLLTAACIAYAVVCGYIWFAQESLLFRATAVAQDHHYSYKTPTSDVWYDRPDGARLHGVRFNEGGKKGLMIYYHGNAGNNGYSERFIERYTALGYEVLAYDYRGYGKSTGERSEEAMYGDALAIFDAEKVRFISENILLVAWSLGSTQAAYVAANRDVSKLIMFAPMSSISDIGRRYYPYIPEFIANYHFRTDLLYSKIKAPVYIYHGSADNVVPIESSLMLVDYFKEGDSYMRVEGATHHNIPWRDEVWEELSGIL